MAVCNIFESLSKETGTFLSFSQYMEDLTREFAEGKSYHIVPSKFVALDVNYSSTDNNPYGEFANSTITDALIHHFENGCAIYRNDVNNYTPNVSKSLFWNAMIDCRFISNDFNEVRYVGDINLQSYEEYSGMGYSEIYCYIPNEAKQYEYQAIKTYNQKFDAIQRTVGDYIEGYTPEEIGGKCVIINDITYNPNYEYIMGWDKNDDGLQPKEVESKSFNINTIVVLYDIVDKDGDVIYSGIPMGIYFTGLVKRGQMSNSITKFVSNEDIYNSGTSYGVRICSRFVSLPGDKLKINNVSLTDNNYNDLSRVLTQMSISQNKMDEILDRSYTSDQNYKDLLAIFKNSRTNVPYIKNIDGKNRWFVNGRMLNSADIENCDCDSYTDDEMDNFVNANSLEISAPQCKSYTPEEMEYFIENNTPPSLPSIDYEDGDCEPYTDEEMDEFMNNNSQSLINTHNCKPYTNGEMEYFVKFNETIPSDGDETNECCCKPYTDEEMEYFVNTSKQLELTYDPNYDNDDLASLRVALKASDSSGATIFKVGDTPTIYVSWYTTYRGSVIVPDETIVNNTNLYPATQTSYICTMTSNIAQDLPIKVITAKNGKHSEEGLAYIKFVNPSYFGAVDSNNPSIADITKLPSYAETSHNQTHKYEGGKEAHMCFAYPKGDNYEMLTSIKDENGLEYLIDRDFIIYEKTINGAEYYVYVDSQKSFEESINFIMR